MLLYFYKSYDLIKIKKIVTQLGIIDKSYKIYRKIARNQMTEVIGCDIYVFVSSRRLLLRHKYYSSL